MTRDRKLIGIFATVALAAASTLGVHLALASGPPVVAVHAKVPLGPDQRLSIQFVGDTMLGDEAQKMLNRNGYDWPFREPVRKALDGDYVIANAEGPFTYHTRPFNLGKEYSYATDPTAVGTLSRMGIDAIDLDNNHAMDAGPVGLRDSMSYLKNADVPSFGAGPTSKRAEEPLLLQTKIGTVAVVGLGENYGSSIEAKQTQPGTLVFSPEAVQRGIDLAHAAGARWVVAFVHWGDNYLPVNAQQRYWAHMLVDAGYDLIVGAGPHVAQPITFIKGTPVVYSMGNFVFGSSGRFDEYGMLGRGLIVTASLSRTEGVQVSVQCIVTDNDVVDFRPRLCTARRSERFLPTLSSRLSVNQRNGYLLPDAEAPPMPPVHPKRATR